MSNLKNFGAIFLAVAIVLLSPLASTAQDLEFTVDHYCADPVTVGRVAYVCTSANTLFYATDSPIRQADQKNNYLTLNNTKKITRERCGDNVKCFKKALPSVIKSISNAGNYIIFNV